MSDVIGDMEKNEQIDANQILNKLLVKENLDYITEIQNPLGLAILETLVTECKNRKITIPQRMLEALVERYKTEMVSYKRQRSAEIISAISNLIKNNTNFSFGEKILGTKENK